MLGMNTEFSPRFCGVTPICLDYKQCVGNYVKDVKSGDFPNEKSSID